MFEAVNSKMEKRSDILIHQGKYYLKFAVRKVKLREVCVAWPLLQGRVCETQKSHPNVIPKSMNFLRHDASS